MSNFRKLMLVLVLNSLVFSIRVNAQTEEIVPLITKSAIEQVGMKCGATITVSQMPLYQVNADNKIGKLSLFVGVDRSNSSESIACVSENIPTIMTGMVGREKDVPPLNEEILRGILNKCEWEKTDGFVGLVEKDELQFQPLPTAKYEHVDCVLNGIKPYHPSKFGFIGNEQYRIEEEQK